MHSLFVKRRVLSSAVSFPSFPNLLSRSDFCCCCPELPGLFEELPVDFSGFLPLFELLLKLELELELEEDLEFPFLEFFSEFFPELLLELSRDCLDFQLQ